MYMKRGNETTNDCFLKSSRALKYQIFSVSCTAFPSCFGLRLRSNRITYKHIYGKVKTVTYRTQTVDLSINYRFYGKNVDFFWKN